MAWFVQCDGCLQMPKAPRTKEGAPCLPAGWTQCDWGHVSCEECGPFTPDVDIPPMDGRPAGGQHDAGESPPR